MRLELEPYAQPDTTRTFDLVCTEGSFQPEDFRESRSTVAEIEPDIPAVGQFQGTAESPSSGARIVG